ncbi:MAG: CHASE2 domain-containing protein, partial [Candidatus Omnitrophica bacterium]|nr:CHASE2 domain-containing protein [Candidatus Omnitrophota bacterium]
MRVSRPARLTFIFTVLVLIVGCASYFRLFEAYELVLLDLRFKTRPIQKIDPNVAIIEIGNDTLTKLSRWPISRDYHATLIKVLSRCGVKAVIFDVIFSEPSVNDALLTEATAQAGNVYYPYSLELGDVRGGFWRSPKYDATIITELEDAACGSGFANILTDRDGKRRRIPLLVEYDKELLPHLTFKAALDILGFSQENIQMRPGRYIKLGDDIRIPVDDEGAALINLAGKWEDTFVHYSYSDILITYAHEVGAQGEIPPKLHSLKDKVCFVGLTATGTADINPNALEPVYPMVGMHANLYNSIVTKSFLRRASPALNLAILFIICLLNLLIALKMRPPKSILFRLGTLVLFVGFGFLLFLLFGLWIDLFLPILIYILTYLGSSLFRYIKELQTRELIEKELSIARNIQ